MAKRHTDKKTTGLRRLLSLLLGLVLLIELLPGGLMAVSDAAEAVTVTADGTRASQITLPQSGRVTLEASCETGETAFQWQLQLDGDWVDIYNAEGAALTLTYAMIAPALENGSASVRCAAGSEAASQPVVVTVSYDVETDSAALNRQRNAQTQTGDQTGTKPHRAPRRTDGTASDFIEVRISYLDAVSKLPIYTGFSATIERGAAYEQTVLSPTYLGYAPYWNAANPDSTDSTAAADSAQHLLLSVPAGYTGDSYTVNVYYKAIQVPYAARYFFQNINDDMYTEDVNFYRQGSALTGTIIANDALELDEKNIVGFTKLYHYPEAVAADGSTVFECYYDRNYYQLKLDANGGYGSEHIYARYGTPFVAATPTQHGYTFAGWDKLDANGKGDGIADKLPATVPAENAQYKALWVSADTTYTAVYWLQNAEHTNKYDYKGSEKRDARAGEVVTGNENWLTADTNICGLAESESHNHSNACKPDILRHTRFEKADENVTVKGDGSTVVNVYYTRRQYTLRFYYAKEYVPAYDTVKTDNHDTTPVYSVVGGSTYNFGYHLDTGSGSRPRPKDKDGNIVNDVESLLYNVPHGEWGKVTALPEIPTKLEGTNYEYTTGTYPADGYNKKGDRFYYLEFTVPYGADLTHLWPTYEVFGRVPLTDAEKNSHNSGNGGTSHLENDGWGNYAYFSGWNGEYNVKYTKDHENATIKCLYPVLNEDLLYDKSFIDQWGDPDTVNFLGFFDNGAKNTWNTPHQWIYKLYIEVLNDEKDAGHYDEERVVDGVTRYYKLYDTVYANDDNKDVAHQTDPPLPGFTSMREKPGGYSESEVTTLKDERESRTVHFYYNRNTYTLVAQNYDQVDQHEGVPYQDSLDRWMGGWLKPVVYPKTLEEGAYMEGGWYTSPDCFTGSEYVYGSTMPDHDISLYVKWVPVERKVRLFRNQKDMETYQTTGGESLIWEEKTVSHGTPLQETLEPEDPSGHNYSFTGWFYIKNGKRVAFTPMDTAVTEDLLVYAEWSNHTAQPYLIRYVLEENATDEWKTLLDKAALYSPADGKAYTVTNASGESRTYLYYAGEDGGYHQQIAADTRGYANQGTTRTFFPKAGAPYNQLYDAFNNTGYYPTLASHSITMEEDPNVSSPTVNVFTFRYVYVAQVDYTVEYRYRDSGELIGSAPSGGIVKKSTSKAVVTERFSVVKDYMPDAFYKRLVLAVVKGNDGTYVGASDNIITFYYTKDKRNAFCAVHYMLQNIDATSDEPLLQQDGTSSNYTESTVYTECIGEIGTKLSVKPQIFGGFTVCSAATVRWGDKTNTAQENDGSFSFEVHAEGTELYVFYTRNTQDYTVSYLRYGSDPTAPKEGDKLLPTVAYTGKYGAVVTATMKSIPGFHCVSAASQSIVLRPRNDQNYIIFYYEELQYTAEYQIWKYGGGTLNRTQEVVKGSTDFLGSTPAARAGYAFTGWYLDAACTQPVGEKGKVAADTGKLTPLREKLSPAPQKNVFYAQFKAIYGDLTIERKDTEDEGYGNGTYIYRVTSQTDPSFVVEVTVSKGGCTTIHALPCGTYTVEQVNDWSWRYSDLRKTVKIQEDENATATFDGGPVKENWLTGSSPAMVNQRR